MEVRTQRINESLLGAAYVFVAWCLRESAILPVSPRTMPQVFLPALWQPVAGAPMLELPGETVGELVDALVALYPSLQPAIVFEGRLRSGVAVAVDGEVALDGLQEKVSPAAEVHFVMAIKGGS